MNKRITQLHKKIVSSKKVIALTKFSKVTSKLSLYWLAFALFSSGFWVERHFGQPNFEQVMYHIQFSFRGLVEIDPSLAKSFIRNAFIYPFILAFMVFLYETTIITIHKIGFKQTFDLLKAFFYKYIYKLIEKSPRTILNISTFLIKKRVLIFLLIGGCAFFLSKVSFWSYLSKRHESAFFNENYIAPKTITPPEKKKNLILIYVESLETTFSDKHLFGEDLLAKLNTKTKDAVSFENYIQTVGTGWTVAGIISSQCGIPLRPINYNGNDLGETVKQFLPNITCLGDILKNAGYKNIFMDGASLLFAGKGKFLSTHGYDELYGKEEWENLGENSKQDFNGWGLYDDLLLEKAKKKLKELEKSSTPFNLTILTLDTHHPNGFISNYCKRKGAHNLIEIVRCTSSLLADFIDYLEKQNYTKNTDIVILGDHLSMKNSAYDKILQEPQRRIFNKFISSNTLEKNREDFSHISAMPSILYMMGFRFKNNRLGLGYSGFGELDPNFSSYKDEDHETRLSSYSKIYLDFWKAKK